MPHIARIKYGVLLFVLAFARLGGYGQCSMYFYSYTTNVGNPIILEVSGDPSSAYTWSFGDGSNDTTTIYGFVLHQYADTGTYNVCVYGIDSLNFCRDTVCQKLDFSCNISGNITSVTDSLTGFTTLTANSNVTGQSVAYLWQIWNSSGTDSISAFRTTDTINLTLPGGDYGVILVIANLQGCADTIYNWFGLTNSLVCTMVQQGVPQSQETYIRNDLPNVNFGLSPDFLTQQWIYNTIISSTANGLMKFDLSFIPPGSVINSATITLFADSTTANSGNGDPGEPTFGQDNTSVLQRITSPWQQLDVTWNNQPNSTSSNAVTVPQSTNNAENYTLDITAFVQLWMQYPDSNFGMMLSMVNSGVYNNLIFCSSAHPDSALRPALNVCYLTNANACNAAFTYNNVGDSVRFYDLSIGGDTLFWTFDDDDSSSLPYPVHYFSSNGIHQTTLTVIDSGGGCSSVTSVNVNGIINDTLCGMVFFDFNGDGLYNAGDYPLPGFEVVIDGNSYHTDNNGFYHIPVGGGGHIVSVIVPPFQYTQTYPIGPSNYAISTTNGDYICGLDFAMGNGFANGIKGMVTDAVNLTVYPNPASSNVVFKTDAANAETNITIYDLYGQAIAKTIIKNGTQVSLDISQWADGLYVWKAVQGGSEVGMGKIVKE